MLSQLSPIMQQLAGVDLDRLLQDISKLPGAVSARLGEPSGQADTDKS